MFVKDLLNRERLALCKVPRTENRVRGSRCVKYLEPKIPLISEPRCWIMGVGPANQAVEEIKGRRRNAQSSGSVALLNAWIGLGTLGLGLAQWAQERHP